jgi:hypothetical protein
MRYWLPVRSGTALPGLAVKGALGAAGPEPSLAGGAPTETEIDTLKRSDRLLPRGFILAAVGRLQLRKRR